MAALVACSALVTSFVAPAAPRASSRSSVSMYYGTGTYQTPFTFEGGDLRRRAGRQCGGGRCFGSGRCAKGWQSSEHVFARFIAWLLVHSLCFVI